MSRLEFHPLANQFPLIEGDEFRDLVASIRKNGLINPIILLDGKILDGRNRYRACIEAGVEPDFADFEEADPEKWAGLVQALNLHRRHLSESQRAMIAAQLNGSGQRREEAARVMNVGMRTVDKAARVVKKGDAQVIDMVTRGEVSVHRAEQVTRGAIPREALFTQKQRGPGRPQGNAWVNRLSRTLDALIAIDADGYDRLVKNWPGDPDLNLKLEQGLAFLRNLSGKVKEPDHATAIA